LALTLYQFLRRWTQRIDTLAAYLACLMLFSLMTLVVADVSLRYLANAPLIWSYDMISLFLLPGIFFFSVGYTHSTHGHVAVDILHNYVSERTRYVFEAITALIAAPVFLFIAWAAAHKTWTDWVSGTYFTSGLEVPTWSASFLLPLGFGLLALRSLLNGWAYLASLFAPQAWISLPPISGTEKVPS
jgi:TRAP-type C4-dicarboxylate transport system permease small subunit